MLYGFLAVDSDVAEFSVCMALMSFAHQDVMSSCESGEAILPGQSVLLLGILCRGVCV